MKTHHFGFSLIELAVVVGIVGILAVLAVPKYNQYVVRSKFVTAYTNALSTIRPQLSAYVQYKNVFPDAADLGVQPASPANASEVNTTFYSSPITALSLTKRAAGAGTGLCTAAASPNGCADFQFSFTDASLGGGTTAGGGTFIVRAYQTSQTGKVEFVCGLDGSMSAAAIATYYAFIPVDCRQSITLP